MFMLLAKQMFTVHLFKDCKPTDPILAAFYEMEFIFIVFLLF